MKWESRQVRLENMPERLGNMQARRENKPERRESMQARRENRPERRGSKRGRQVSKRERQGSSTRGRQESSEERMSYRAGLQAILGPAKMCCFRKRLTKPERTNQSRRERNLAGGEGKKPHCRYCRRAT